MGSNSKAACTCQGTLIDKLAMLTSLLSVTSEVHLKGGLQKANDLRQPVRMRGAVLPGSCLRVQSARYDVGQRARQPLHELWPDALLALLDCRQLLLQRPLCRRNIPADEDAHLSCTWLANPQKAESPSGSMPGRLCLFLAQMTLGFGHKLSVASSYQCHACQACIHISVER